MGGEIDQADTAELRSALSWWMEAGVDIAVEETPRNWLRPAAPSVPIPAASAAAPSQSEAPQPQSLEEFRAWLSESTDLPFSAHGRRVLPVGTPEPEVMLIADMAAPDCCEGDGPIGAEAWTLAQRMLRAVGFEPADAYRASLSCFHSVSGLQRGPDFDACADIARRHVALVKPRRLLLLGDAPCRALLGKPLTAARGHVHKVEGVLTVATFHPAFLMNQPLQKEAAWADLLLLTEDQ